jgi:predicted RNase H-like HicB family nuclease
MSTDDKPTVEGLDLKTTIVTYKSKSTGLFTSTCHALNLSASGKTADEAEQNLEALLNQFLEKLAKDGRLPEMLTQLPDEGDQREMQ